MVVDVDALGQVSDLSEGSGNESFSGDEYSSEGDDEDDSDGELLYESQDESE